MAVTYYFPGGREKVLTFSYDDGTIHDRKLVEIFNKYGMKGTFNLNVRSDANAVPSCEYKSLYTDNGHEVACHGVSHPFFEKTPVEAFVNEVRDNRIMLEDLVQMPVKGMAYPCGIYGKNIETIMQSLGIVYSRTTQNSGTIHRFPTNWMEWHPSAHHGNENLMNLAESFLGAYWTDTPRMLYVWGHSFEFDRNNNWDVIENFCKRLQGHDEVWYATNMEIYEYIQAANSLCYTADCSIVRNPSCQTVWVRRDGVTIPVKPGETVKLG